MQSMIDSPTPSIETILPEHLSVVLPDLMKLLQDAVSSGASIGFVVPPADEEASVYWHGVLQDVAERRRILLVARDAGSITGAVQLELPMKPNARHRAEIQKLMVFQQHRQKGTARHLMTAIERSALEHGRFLIVLDT